MQSFFFCSGRSLAPRQPWWAPGRLRGAHTALCAAGNSGMGKYDEVGSLVSGAAAGRRAPDARALGLTLRYDAPPGRARRARRCDAGRAGDGRRVFAGRRRRSEWARRTAWGTVSGSQLRSRCPCSLCVARKLCLPATPSSASRPRKRDVTACVGGRALRAVKKDADRRGVRVCDHALRRAWVSLRRVRPCALCHPAPTGCLSQPPERARVPRDPRVSCACVQSAPRGSRRPRRPRRPDGRLCSHARRRHAGCCST